MKKAIKVKDMPPEWQKNYNAFYQTMVNAKSEKERHQIVEDRKKKVIEKIHKNHSFFINHISTKDAKSILFYNLLCKNNNSLTDNEVEIMTFLVKDREIQEALEVGNSL